jgi:hypothetical protein
MNLRKWLWRLFKKSPEQTGSKFGVAYGAGNLDYRGQYFMPKVRGLGTNRVMVGMGLGDPALDQKLLLLEAQIEPADEVVMLIFTTGVLADGNRIRGNKLKQGVEIADQYYDRIAELVKLTNGKIKYWQRDQEPFSSAIRFPKNAPEYMRSQKLFYGAVKDAQPDAKVVGLGLAGGWNNRDKVPAEHDICEELSDLGFSDYCDLIDIHAYGHIGRIPDMLAWFRSTFALPVCCCEVGSPDPRTLPSFMEIWNAIKGDYNAKRYDKCVKYVNDLRDSGDMNPIASMFFRTPGEPVNQAIYDWMKEDMVERAKALNEGGAEFGLWWQLQGRDPVNPVFGHMHMHDSTTDVWKETPAAECFRNMVKTMA